MPTQKRGPEGVNRPKGPEGASRSRGPEEAADDTEGHMMLPNETLSRHAAQSREQEIRRNLERREVKSEARRPFFKKGK